MRRAAWCVLLAAACTSSATSGGSGKDLSVPPVNDDAGPEPFYDLSCVGSSQQAKLKPITLIFLLDRSGSMGDGVNGDPALKWNPVTDALKTFFSDPLSKGVSASLQYFPFGTDQCNPSVYYMASVNVRPLPDPAFGVSMDATKPAGATPTLPAVQGAIDLAGDTVLAHPGQPVAIVLVTDGDPDQCSSSANNVALAVGKVATMYPTYVIGVGTDLMSLNIIATQGGTGAPTLVAVGDPATTNMQFLSALDNIRGLVLSCNVPIPPPPGSNTIDFTQVNVNYTPGTGAPSLLVYDKDCAGPGWRYDNPAMPTAVQLCPQSCDVVRADRNGRLDVLFGCTTIGNLVM